MSNEKAAPIPGMDALDRLSFALHGRKATPRDFIGGCNANILDNAAEQIATLTAEVAALKKENFILDDVLTQQTERIAELKAEIARRDAPVSDAEWESRDKWLLPATSSRRAVNALILARATPPQSDANLSCGCLRECVGHPSRTPPPQSGGKE